MDRQTRVENEHAEKTFAPTLDWKDYDQNLDKQQRKNAKRLALAVVGLLFLIVFANWYRHEKNFRSYENKTVSVDEEYISEKCPQLFLTEEEMNLADTIWDIPEIQKCMNADRLIVLESEKVQDELEAAVPDEAEIQQICAKRGTVYIDYYIGEERTIISYYNNSLADEGRWIHKSVSVHEETFNSETTGYSLQYSEVNEMITYEKTYKVKDLYGILFE